LGVLDPVEKSIANFLKELKSAKPLSKESEEKARTEREILTDFISDELLPKEDHEHLMQKAKQLLKQLDAVEFASNYFSTDIMLNMTNKLDMIDIIEFYMKLVVNNQKPTTVLKLSSSGNITNPKESLDTACKEFLKSAYAAFQRIHHDLGPLEAQPSLSMTMPSFEEPEDVHSYIYPFQQRSQRVVWLNGIKAELKALESGFQDYSGVFDTSLRRQMDQYKQGVVSLLKRVELLRADFSRQPLPVRAAISSEPAQSQPSCQEGFLSKNLQI